MNDIKSFEKTFAKREEVQALTGLLNDNESNQGFLGKVNLIESEMERVRTEFA